MRSKPDSQKQSDELYSEYLELTQENINLKEQMDELKLRCEFSKLYIRDGCKCLCGNSYKCQRCMLIDGDAMEEITKLRSVDAVRSFMKSPPNT